MCPGITASSHQLWLESLFDLAALGQAAFDLIFKLTQQNLVRRKLVKLLDFGKFFMLPIWQFKRTVANNHARNIRWRPDKTNFLIAF